MWKRILARRAVLAGAIVGVLPSRRVWAHAILEESDPKANGSVPAGSVTLKLRFNSRIDRARSRLTLTGPGNAKTVVPIDSDGPPDRMTATVSLTQGAYTLRWQVLAIDGHITRGDVPFTVTGH